MQLVYEGVSPIINKIIKKMMHTSERKEWKYPFTANLEAEYTAWPGAGVFPAALLI